MLTMRNCPLNESVRKVATMADHAAIVLKLVTEPDYAPMTLKAMARRFELADDDYPEFPRR